MIKEEIKIHLDSLVSEVKDSLSLPDKERIISTYRQTYIKYPRMNEILEKLEKYYNFPKNERMPGMYIVGESNIGKTTIINRFMEMHPAETNLSGQPIIPIIKIQMPFNMSGSALNEKILESLNIPVGASSANSKKRLQVSKYLKLLGTKMIIIDEFKSIELGDKIKQKLMLEEIKFLSNDLQVPIVFASIPGIESIIASDPQLRTRYEEVVLRKMNKDREFAYLVKSLEKTLPLKKPSFLHKKSIIDELYYMSDGVLGNLIFVLQTAADEAIISKKERID